MNKTYLVRLTDDERHELVQLTKSGKAAVSKIKHAPILLHVDANGPNWSDAHVAKALHCQRNTVRNVRQRFVEQGLEAALVRKKQVNPSRQCLLDGAKEAHLIALRCGPPPKAKPSGPYSCSPINSSRSMSLRPSPMKRSDRRSKKHPQAALAQGLGDAPGAHCRLCGPHGRCPGSLSAPL
jgi:Homeodomain-like domain